MTRTALAILLAAVLLAGCSTLNSAGFGGKPHMACTFPAGLAVLDDRLLGSDDVHGSVVRRFEDLDPVCAALMMRAMQSFEQGAKPGNDGTGAAKPSSRPL